MLRDLLVCWFMLSEHPELEVDTQSYSLVYLSPRKEAIPSVHLCLEAHLAVPADALCVPVRSIR